MSARRVVPGGIAHGLDASPDMLTLARANAVQAGLTDARFLHGRIEDIPQPDGQVDVVSSNLSDPHGTSTAAIDTSSQAITLRYFTPFGQPRGTAPTTWPGTRGYVGGTTDTTTGLTDLGAREYNPATPSFISPDPILNPYNPVNINPYDYAANNPATNTDPTGLVCVPGASSNANCNGQKAQDNDNTVTGNGQAGTGTNPGGNTPSGPPGSTVLPARACSAYEQFLTSAQSSYPDYYSLGGASGVLLGLASFCGNNLDLCGSQLTVRLLATQVGPSGLRPQETLNQLEGIALPSLTAAGVFVPNPFGKLGGPGHRS